MKKKSQIWFLGELPWYIGKLKNDSCSKHCISDGFEIQQFGEIITMGRALGRMVTEVLMVTINTNSQVVASSLADWPGRKKNEKTEDKEIWS